MVLTPDTASAVAVGNHTVSFQIAKSSQAGGDADAWIGNASVAVLFVPFGNGGTRGSLSPIHRPRHSSGKTNR